MVQILPPLHQGCPPAPVKCGHRGPAPLSLQAWEHAPGTPEFWPHPPNTGRLESTGIHGMVLHVGHKPKPGLVLTASLILGLRGSRTGRAGLQPDLQGRGWGEAGMSGGRLRSRCCCCCCGKSSPAGTPAAMGALGRGAPKPGPRSLGRVGVTVWVT